MSAPCVQRRAGAGRLTMNPRSLIVSVLALSTIVITACSGAAEEEEEAAQGDEAAVKASEVCEGIRTNYVGVGSITASTSGLRCYDDQGARKDVFPPNSTVFVLNGPTQGGANASRFKVQGRNQAGASIQCWVSKDYLCEGSATGS